MIISVVDTETTGDSETDEVVDVACVRLRMEDGALVSTRCWHSLFRPSVPVTAVARAAHHLTDEQLASAPRLKDTLPLPTDGDFMACHNAAFDLQMLLQSGVPRETLPSKIICTWKCAMHLFPESPKHSNQVLRYHLEVEQLKVRAPKLPPHRALPDALVTAGNLLRMLTLRSAEELVELSSQPVLLHKIKFGKFRGMRWEDLDDGYLHWILSKSFGEDEKYTAQHWINKRREACQEPQSQPSQE